MLPNQETSAESEPPSSHARVRHIGVAYRPATLSDPDDQKLVDAILSGDSSVACTLYDSLRPSVDHALRRVLHGRHTDFEDLVQITFERVVRTIVEGRFEGRSRLSTWAGAIAAHVAMDSLRRRTREQRVFAEPDASAGEPQAVTLLPERQLEARSEVKRLHGILLRMKPDLSNILVLHEVLGHSVPELAELHGIKISAAQSRLSRARKEFARRCSAKIASTLPDESEESWRPEQ